ncbi:MAG: hypothetical protein SNJ55_07485 [Chloroherpetonaceae bacterium]
MLITPFRVFALTLFFMASTTCALHAQQNLFNIPSGDITPTGKWFYQHQLNFYEVDDLETKSHFVYGIAEGWDVGINFIDLPLRLSGERLISYNADSRRKPLYPLVMATAQKQFNFPGHLNLNIGTQLGPNLSSSFETKKIAYFNYGLLKWHPIEQGYVSIGGYQANSVIIGGDEDQIGMIAGFEYKLNDRFLLMGDIITGDHKKSQTVLGGGVNVNNYLQVFVGKLFDFPNGDLDSGIVLEINLYGWDFKRRSSH